jgi:putative aldouronate transport system substrate-binding protein
LRISQSADKYLKGEKRMKKSVLKIIAFAAALAVLAGCSGKKNGDNGESKKNSELSIFMHIGNTTAYKDDFPVFKKAAELTGVSLKSFVSQSATDSASAYSIMMSSGTLADIVNYEKKNIEKYAYDGAFIPLDDLIDKNAPHLKAFIDANPEAKKVMTSADGKIYIIPNFLDGVVEKGWYIRKDWLDKLGLSVPATVDEYHDVLKAFKEKDPNGNGKSDEVPFFNRDQNMGASEILPLFGVRSAWNDEGGVVTYGQYTPEYKNAMVNTAKWYKDGLIDPEIYTRGNNAREKLLGDNLGGSTHDWLVSTASYNNQYKDKIPGFYFAPITPPADINGKVWETSKRGYTSGYGWAISSQNPDPEATIKYFDFWFTEEGRRLETFGLEGEQYDMVDGRPVFKESFVNNERPVLQRLNEIGANLFIGYKQDFWYEEQIMDHIAKQGVRLYTDGGFAKDKFPEITMTTDEKAVYDEKWASIGTYIKETTQKWVLGASSVEADFDGYMSKLKEMGMDKIVEIYQAAYDRYQGEKQ